MNPIGYERHDFSPSDFDGDRDEGWTCDGCNREIPETSCEVPQIEINESRRREQYCQACVEDGRVPQPSEEYMASHCPRCAEELTGADRLLIATGCIDRCSACEADRQNWRARNLQRLIQAETERIYRARWDQRWLQAAGAFLGLVGVFAAVMVWRVW